MNLFPINSNEYSSSENSYISNFIKVNSNNKFFEVDKKESFQHRGIKKTGPIYAMHRYWTKQPISVIKEYIEYFCPENGLVLDPFCGSGTTGSAALLSKRSVILSDISKIATFISKNYTEKTNIEKLLVNIENINFKMKPLLKKFYQTKCTECFESATIKDWIYSEVFSCSSCDSDIQFLSKGSNWEEIITQKHQKFVQCKNCTEKSNKDNLLSKSFQVSGLRFSCKNCKIRKKFKNLDEQDQKNLKDSTLQDIYNKSPNFPLPRGVNTNQAMNKKIKNTNEFFSPITLKILTELWFFINEVGNNQIRSKLQFIFTSIMFRVTKLYRLRVKGQGGILSGTLYVPSLSQDINVWDVFQERVHKVLKGFTVLNANLPSNYHAKRLISTHSATNLSKIPDNSIDYIYTDPPYGGNINYSELNLIWESWFGIRTEIKNEVIINEIGQDKGINEYSSLLQESINEMFRVLKPGHWCTVVFNSSSPKIWALIQKIVLQSGFSLARDISKIESNMTTAKQTQSRKTARRYFLLNLKKSSNVKSVKIIDSISKVKKTTKRNLEEKIRLDIIQFLELNSKKQASFDEIYENLITNYLTSTEILDFNLQNILKNHFINLNGDFWTNKMKNDLK